ncbi:hypothetical protein FA09DRAFT_328062 [Tilletiopsis washingtonensis]|jgi:hypothetical protein|uniref:Uncharacterized protein n=1 Tax=Tilletiopsis washingtonensis TaxID=58919 RepID=A0A316ZHZ4_9BASI|nr:hypothetical protein FA09DRAFT_328062 [Tilletiopsis washingtonensis]PWN99915.1 hypothetical protein FA09DRAFT_328062 [Tilletiopsis washingtonensis]
MAVPAPLRPLLGLLQYIAYLFTSLIHPSSLTTGAYTLQLHSTPLVLYRGPWTVVHVTVSGPQALASDAQVALQRRGWRAGLVGWDAARYLGARGGELDVSPVTTRSFSRAQEPLAEGAPARTALSRAQVSRIKDLAASQRSEKHTTFSVRLPASAGDGYFRLVVKGGGSTIPSPVFRLYSLSLSSACPRGSTVLPPTLPIELVVRTLSLALSTALLALSPLGFLAKFMPRGVSRWIAARAYRAAGGDARRDAVLEKAGAQQKLDRAKEGVKRIPFASAGIRTTWDVNRDEEIGRAGVRWT